MTSGATAPQVLKRDPHTMALILTVSMMLAGIVLKGLPDTPTADVRTVAPYFELEQRPSGATLPLRASGVTAAGTASLDPGSEMNRLPYSG